MTWKGFFKVMSHGAVLSLSPDSSPKQSSYQWSTLPKGAEPCFHWRCCHGSGQTIYISKTQFNTLFFLNLKGQETGAVQPSMKPALFCPQFIANIFNFSMSEGMRDAQRKGCGWMSALHRGKCQSKQSNGPECSGTEEKHCGEWLSGSAELDKNRARGAAEEQRPTNTSRSARWRLVGGLCRWCTILSGCSSLLRSASETAAHCIPYLIFLFWGTKPSARKQSPEIWSEMRCKCMDFSVNPRQGERL